MTTQHLITLAGSLKNAKYICQLERDAIQENDALLTFLDTNEAPYYNYVLCALDEDMDLLPFYVGYTADVARRLSAHAARIAFDVVFLYHAPCKETALSNEQALMDLLGTRDLFNGSLTQMGAVSREQVLEAVSGLSAPVDRVQRYAAADDVRKTYYLNYVLLEALRTYAFDQRMEISETVRHCLVTGIPEDYLESAYEKLHGGTGAAS
ncbi:hypothetical protein [Agathobaculum sp.]|uniref:hypothetical protein n=1 Tax=Agathobaculum sp. TaxID=2048138 RepID=UPI002A7EF6CF|nr:hypothetical protein [Agathobaculum sp.]MDY3618465.1 hypothetical protein [Agathobaculum sp.]